MLFPITGQSAHKGLYKSTIEKFVKFAKNDDLVFVSKTVFILETIRDRMNQTKVLDDKCDNMLEHHTLSMIRTKTLIPLSFLVECSY